MNRSKSIRPRRVLALIATLFAAMVTAFMLPAYGQQEVDPTWYNPWAATNTTVANSSKPQAAAHRHHGTVKSASSAPVAAKFHRKRPTTRPKSS
jgi:hypothetical protein